MVKASNYSVLFGWKFMEEKTKRGKRSSVDVKALKKKLNVGIFGNRLLMRSVNVGSNFNNMLCDLAIDGRGRVTLTSGKMRINTDLKSIDPNILRASIEYLDKHIDNRGFKSAIQKMKAILEFSVH